MSLSIFPMDKDKDETSDKHISASIMNNIQLPNKTKYFDKMNFVHGEGWEDYASMLAGYLEFMHKLVDPLFFL